MPISNYSLIHTLTKEQLLGLFLKERFERAREQSICDRNITVEEVSPLKAQAAYEEFELQPHVLKGSIVVAKRDTRTYLEEIKVVKRLITYRGPARWVDDTIAGSWPLGAHHIGSSYINIEDVTEQNPGKCPGNCPCDDHECTG